MIALHRLSAALMLGAALVACGDSEEPRDTREAGRAITDVRIAGESSYTELVAEDYDVVVVFALDGASADAFSFLGGAHDTTPRLARLAAEGVVAEDHVLAATGLNGAMATLLTGRRSREHGVSSVREPGRAALRDEERTLAEAFREAGWRTLFAVAAPQLHPALSGFDQGFDAIEVPPPAGAGSGQPRAAHEVMAAALPRLRRWIEDGERVFAVIQLSDLDPRGDRAARDPHGAAWLDAHLGAHAARNISIADALAKAERNPAAALSDLDALLKRRRGADVALAWRAALRDGRASALDAEIGEVVELLFGFEREKSALIAIQGLRGTVLDPPQESVGARFLPPVLSTPLVLYAGGRAAGLRIDGITSAVDLPRALSDVFELGLAPTDFASTNLVDAIAGEEAGGRFALASEAGLARHVLVTAEMQRERAAGAEDYTFTRSGVGFGLDVPMPTYDDAMRAALDRFAAPATLEVRAVATSDGVSRPVPVEVRWRVAAGLTTHARVTGVGSEDLTTDREAQRRRSGVARLEGLDAALEVGLSARAADVRLDFLSSPLPVVSDLPPVGASDLRAPDPLDQVGMPRIVVPRVDAWTSEELPGVELERSSGVWWRFAVNDPGECEALLCVWPPRDANDELEVSAGGAAIADPVPGRSDAFVVRGTAPFDLTVKLEPREELAFAVRVAGRVVPATRVRVDGRRQGTESELSVVVPGWLPPLTDALSREPEAPDSGGAWSIVRRDPAGAFGASGAPKPAAIEILRRVRAGE